MTLLEFYEKFLSRSSIMAFTVRINSDLVSSRSAISIGSVVIPTKSVSYICLISSRLGLRISTILRLWEIRYTMKASFNLPEIPSCSNNPLMSKRSRGCCLSSAAIIFPANRSSNETTGTSANPKASSAVLVIRMTTGSYTVPRNTGDNSTFTTRPTNLDDQPVHVFGTVQCRILDLGITNPCNDSVA